MPDTYRLPSIPYLRLRVAMRAEAEAALPEYHGSMLRGAFGHALRRTVCTMGPAQPCGSCQLRRACVYTRIFETFVEDEPPPFLRGVDQAVRPYVFEPRGWGGTRPLELGSRTCARISERGFSTRSWNVAIGSRPPSTILTHLVSQDLGEARLRGAARLEMTRAAKWDCDA
jgi:hypothetical protein